MSINRGQILLRSLHITISIGAIQDMLSKADYHY